MWSRTIWTLFGQHWKRRFGADWRVHEEQKNHQVQTFLSAGPESNYLLKRRRIIRGAKNLFEARIAAQRIEFRFSSKPHQPGVALGRSEPPATAGGYSREIFSSCDQPPATAGGSDCFPLN
jgi:hypothetical protein